MSSPPHINQGVLVHEGLQGPGPDEPAVASRGGPARGVDAVLLRKDDIEVAGDKQRPPIPRELGPQHLVEEGGPVAGLGRPIGRH
jgi:hypothetical protein